MNTIEDNKEWKAHIPIYLRILIKSMNCRAEAIFAKYNLKAGYMPYIMTLYCLGKLTMKELSERTGTDKSNTTRIISELRSRGLVDDDRKSKNSKKYNVFLTDLGIDVAAKSKEEFDLAVDYLFSDLSNEEVNMLADILKKVKVDPNAVKDMYGHEKNAR